MAVVTSADESFSSNVGLRLLPLLYKDWISNNKASVDLHNEIHANGKVPFSNGQNQLSGLVGLIFIYCNFITSTYRNSHVSVLIIRLKTT